MISNKKRLMPIPVLFALAMVLFVPAIYALYHDDVGSSVSYEVMPQKVIKMKIPKVALTASEEAKLVEGKPVCKLLDSDAGLKSGFMRVFLPYPPSTVWGVIMDIKHFDLVSADYPKNGSLTSKRRSFMPYVFDSKVCGDKNQYLYQLLVMPFVDPRHFALTRYGNRRGFPWESHWRQTKDLKCQDEWNPEMNKFREDAVLTTKNDGAWHLSPLPKKYVKTKEDLLKTDCVYFVDTNPGGNLGAILPIVNKATKIAMPALADNVIFHCERWEDHLKKHHPAADYNAWKKEIADYKKAVGYAD